MTRQEIKERSKQQLGGSIFDNKWMMALLTCLVLSLIMSVSSFIPLIGSIIVLGPLSYGVALIFIKIARTGERADISDLFEGFTTDFGGTFLIGLMTGIFTILWSLLFVIPGIIKTYSYSMVYYIKVDHPEYTWNQCIKESMGMMNGHKADLFVQDLSFIGWMIVGMCACGIGTLWVTPYMELSRANFYESLRGVTVNDNANPNVETYNQI